MSEKKDKKDSKKPILSQKDIKFLKLAIPIILILIAMFVAYEVRSGPINLTGIENQIETNTYNQIQNMIASQVDSEYPNLNQINRQELITSRMIEIEQSGIINYGGQEVKIEDIVKQNVAQVKSGFQADNGQTYLNAIDPYHFLDISINYVENGHTGDGMNGETTWRYQRLAPIGVKSTSTPEFHVWLQSILLKANGINENSDIGEKTKVIFLLPVIFAILSVIPIFLIIRKFSDNMTAFFGSLFLVCIGTFVSRTIAGFVDTDAYNIFFPLLISSILIYGLLNNKLWINTLCACIAGFFLTIYNWAWTEGWYMLIFIMFSLGLYIIYNLIIYLLKIKNKNSNKIILKNISKYIISSLAFLFSSFIFGFLLFNRNIFSIVYSGLNKSLTDIASISQINIWPNVLSSVAELNPASFGTIINSIGGKLVFFIALLALVLILLNHKDDNNKLLNNNLIIIFSIIWYYLIINHNFLVGLTANLALLFIVLLFIPVGLAILKNLYDGIYSENIFLVILLSSWIAGTIFMSLNGVRFILLLAPAFAIAFALGLFQIFKLFNEFIENIKKIEIDTNNSYFWNSIVLGGIVFAIISHLILSVIIDNLKVSRFIASILVLFIAIGIMYVLIGISKELKSIKNVWNILFILIAGLMIGYFFNSFLIGIILGIIGITLNIMYNKEKKLFAGTAIITSIFILIFTPMYASATNISNGTTPNFDDAWYEAMYNIRDNSDEDAIITSWWDFGHFFINIGRGATFDGASQTTPRAHWVGKLLMESDEKVSQDILRMLVCGGNEAHNTMLEYTEGTAADAVKINKLIYETLGENLETTKEILENNNYYEFNRNQIDEIMNYLSCSDPPENFLITSEDMVGKAGVWAHWGSWDFTRKYVHDNYRLKSAEEISNEIDANITIINQYFDELRNIDTRSRTENVKRNDLINSWLAPYPSYVPLQGRYLYPCSFTNTTVRCQNNVEINLFSGKIVSNLGEEVTFNNVILPQQDGSIRVVKQSENGEFDAVLIPSGQNYQILLTQAPLGNSLFTKLFYLEGFGTTLYDKFDDKQSATGVRIKTWKVNFNESVEIIDEEEINNIRVSNNSSTVNINEITFTEMNSTKESNLENITASENISNSS